MSYCHFIRYEGVRVKVPGCQTYLYADGCPCKTDDMADKAAAIKRLKAQRAEIDLKLTDLDAKPYDAARHADFHAGAGS